MKGAPEVVLERCASFQSGSGTAPLDDAERTKLLAVNESMAKEALRVLGIAYKELPQADRYADEEVEKDLVFLGYVGMMDPPREEAVEAVKVCRQVSIRPVMITGDHKLTAVAVAREIGIFREGDSVLTGEELSRMDEAALAAVVEKVTVYARVSPMDKLKIVRAWKDKGHVVAMTGDGVNDAPALKHADIGVAMGITGTDVAKESADIVLADDNFATIVKAIERGRWIYDNIQKYLTYLLRANITEVVVLGGVVMYLGPALPAAAAGGHSLHQPGERRLAGAGAGHRATRQGHHAAAAARSERKRVLVRRAHVHPASGRSSNARSSCGSSSTTWTTSRSRAPRCS